MLEDIEKFLAQMGFQHEPHENTRALRFETYHMYGRVKMTAGAYNGQAYVKACPVTEQPKEGWGPSVKGYITKLAVEPSLYCLVIDSFGDISISTEMDKQIFDYESFSFVVRNITDLCEKLTVQILQANAFEGK